VPLKRVVITGAGAVSPFGIGRDRLVEGVRNGCSGVRVMPEWSGIKGLGSFVAAPVPEFDAKKILPRTSRRTMGPMATYAAVAALEAVKDAGLSEGLLGSGRTGVIMGSTTGSPSVNEDFYREFVPDNSIEGLRSGTFFKIMGHTCSANVAQLLGINGMQWATVSACTSSIQAVGLGFMLIQSGRQDVVVCGGADEVHHTVTVVFDVLKAASRWNDAPDQTPRPFDARRDGVVCGAGSGVLVLESLEHALSRKAEPIAEVLGFGTCNDSGHVANPSVEAMVAAMRLALEDARVLPEEIQYVNAHATGTIAGDATEAHAISAVAGNQVPVSSFKGYIGHTLGAAGALETIILLETLKKGEIFPTLNLEEPDSDCSTVMHAQREQLQSVDVVLKNNFALGGVNSSLVLGRFRNDR